MPRQDPQAVFVDSNDNPFGAVWGLNTPGAGMASEEFRTERGPTADVIAHGAEGDGSTDETAAFESAISAAAANDGVAYVPPGEYLVDTVFDVPEGVSICGAGIAKTTIRSTDTANIETFIANSHNTFSGFTLDQNASGRSQSWTTGIHIQDCNDCRVENIRFINLSTTVNGSGIFFEAEETDSQDTYRHLVHNCYFRGDNQNGDNGGDFLIRARTAFGSDLEADQFTRHLRNIRVDNCYFTGEGKAAVEFVGPATRQCLITNSVTRDFTACVGAFEFSLGAKDCTAANCYVIDSYGDSGLIGFYSDGYQGGTPNRRSEDNTFFNCHVRNIEELQTGSYIRGFRTRLDDRAKFLGCSAKNITAPTPELASGFDITQSTNVTIESPMVSGVHRGVRLNSAELPRINNPLFDDVSTLVYEETAADRPRWNGVLGGGALGGVDLSSVGAYHAGDEAISSSTGRKARYVNGSWQYEDGTAAP